MRAVPPMRTTWPRMAPEASSARSPTSRICSSCGSIRVSSSCRTSRTSLTASPNRALTTASVTTDRVSRASRQAARRRTSSGRPSGVVALLRSSPGSCARTCRRTTSSRASPPSASCWTPRTDRTPSRFWSMTSARTVSAPTSSTSVACPASSGAGGEVCPLRSPCPGAKVIAERTAVPRRTASTTVGAAASPATPSRTASTTVRTRDTGQWSGTRTPTRASCRESVTPEDEGSIKDSTTSATGLRRTCRASWAPVRGPAAVWKGTGSPMRWTQPMTSCSGALSAARRAAPAHRTSPSAPAHTAVDASKLAASVCSPCARRRPHTRRCPEPTSMTTEIPIPTPLR